MRKSNKKYKMKRQPDLRLGKASTEEIVKKTVERLDPDGDWEEVYDAVYSALQTNQFRMLRSGDTLLFYHVNTPIADEAHLFTIEKQEDLMESLRDLGQAMKIAGFTKIKGTTEYPSILRIIRKANTINFVVRDKALRAYGESGPIIGYEFEIEVK
jgi:hypothetical protein